METIIKKAIEGGYLNNFTNDGSKVIDICDEDTDDGKISIAFFLTETDRFYFNKYKIFSDPLFWQALGKKCGWGDENGIDENDYFLGEIDYPEIAEGKAFREVWEYNALRFHELNLTEGFDKAVAWLSDLIKE